MRINLATKGFILLVIPTIVQSGLLVGLTLLHLESGFYPQRAQEDKDIHDAWTKYMLDDFAVLRRIKTSVDQESPLDPDCDRYLQNLKADIQKLKELYRDFPERRSREVIEAEDFDKIRESIKQTFIGLDQIYDARSKLVAMTKQAGLQIDRKQAYQLCHSPLKLGIAQLRGQIMNEEVESSDPQLQAKIRGLERNILTAGAVINFILLVLLGIFFTRDILKRLRVMLDNVDRMAREQELHAIVSGNDELTSLDAEFHELSEKLKETVHPYKAMMENSQALICSVDANGRILAVNDAAISMLGFRPESLKGAWLIDLIETSQQEQFAEEIKTIAKEEHQISFETRIVCENRSVIDLQWSASWSPQDKTVFCIAHDITQRKAAEQLQQEVLQMVSHDLRSPLAAISSFHELLEEGMYGELAPKGIEQVGVAKRSTMRMLKLVNDLLDAERMRTGMLELDKCYVRAADVFQQAIESVASLAGAKEIAILSRPTELTLYADEQRLVQVLINLLSNAIKFSPAGSKISLNVDELPGLANIIVSDEGRGIPAHLLDSVFGRFNQLKASDATQKGGSGLGLSICKALVELHGGDISVASTVGSGSTFSFRIPLDVPASLRGQPPSKDRGNSL